MPARVPTSRAYWNLRAEQVVDSVFDHETGTAQNQPHLVPVDVDVHEPTTQPSEPSERRSPSTWLLPLISGIAVAGVICSAWLVSSLQRSRLELERKQNADMIEQLREQVAAQQNRAEEMATPEEASHAIQSLEPLTLPIQQPPIQQPLTVDPLNSEQGLVPMEPAPQLTGVVKGPGGSSSAIFQLGQGSVSAGISEAIGSSGWVLSEVTDSGAVISRNGQRQTLSVGGLF
ncbi:putative conserved membrane protein [Synechococcus sp. RS9907]|uniref:pilus assembly protein PilZ n=1 Tax=Synechococcus sp. RS9907 TaxID=221350 RepID=UPI00185FDA05|nr:pilus assembly protein PilZ [Synechococcus sp. RS9907]QNI83700.1 putative conserved membrane protein [Synechococcus sp. RS9907]